MQITDALHGRMIELVERKDNGGITIHTVCGHRIDLDMVDGEIQMTRQAVQILMPGQELKMRPGKFGG